MDIKSKNTDNETEEITNKSEQTTKQTAFDEENSPPPAGSIRYKLSAKWIRVVMFIISAVLTAYALTAIQALSCCEYVWDIEAAVMGDEQPARKQSSTDSAQVSKSEINSLYNDLCIVASQVLRYDSIGKWDTYKRTSFKNEINNVIALNGKVYFEEDGPREFVVNGDRYDYYVGFGSSYYTNISGLTSSSGYDDIAAKLESDDVYYIRLYNKIYKGGKSQSRINYYDGDTVAYSENLPLGSSYYDEETAAHIFCYNNLGYFDTVFEDEDSLTGRFTYTDDEGNTYANPPMYKLGSRYVYNEKLDEYKLDKTLQKLNDSGITVAIGLRPQISKAAGSVKLTPDEQISLSKFITISLFPTGAVLFIIIIMLVVRCGYNRDTDTFTPSKWLDKQFTAELFFITACAALVGAGILMNSLNGEIDIAFGQKNIVFFLSYALGIFLLWIIGFGSVLVLLRKLKSRTLFTTSAVIKLIGFTVKGIADIINKGENRLSVSAYNKLTVARKMLVRNLIFAAATAIAIIFLTVAVFENWVEYDDIMIVGVYETFYFVYFVWYFLSSLDYFHDSDKLCRKIDTIGTGEKYTGEPMSKTSAFFEPFKVLDTLDERIKTQAEEMVKSERTKVELVTNVSHDLKTPLTSIISYTYLLSKEDMSDEAKDYVAVLQQKTEKLKSIVNDVFTLAKAASGAEVKSEQLDLAMLVNQTVASNADIIDKSGISVKTQIPDKPVFIIGDGDKLSRVFQNLLDNALKYSLDGTRVFIDMTVGERAEVAFKNTSKDEMNFTAEEITERFTRGDKSRTDGGSGLGLSIAKTFTEACGGDFRIELEGDMFKAIAEFDLMPEDDEGQEEKPESLL